MSIGRLTGIILITLTGTAMLLAGCGKDDNVIKVITVTDSLKVGLVAWYPFNNSANDATTNGYNGAVHNIASAADRNGNANAAYYFDGYSSYISVNDAADLRLVNTDFTISAWIKADSYNQSNYSCIFSKRASGAVNGGWQFVITGNTLTPTGVISFGADAGNASAYGSKVIETNKWHMVTAEYTLATQTLSMYIDGVLNNTTTNIVPPNNLTGAQLFIGKDNYLNSFYFQGTLDDLRIYNRLLSTKQLGYLMAITN